MGLLLARFTSSHSVDSFSQEEEFPKTTRESSWGHIPRMCAISSAWQESVSVALCFPNEVKVLLAHLPLLFQVGLFLTQ